VILSIGWLPIWWQNNWWIPALLGFIFLGLAYAASRRHWRDIREREQLFRTLAEHSPDLIMRLDADFRYLYTNPAVSSYTGLTPEELTAKSSREMGFPPGRSQSWKAALQQVFQTGQPLLQEFEFEGPAGLRHLEARLVPERSTDQSVGSVLVISRDITERREAEEALRHSRARLEGIVRISDDAIISIDDRQNITMFNDGAEKIFGHIAAEIVGKGIDSLIPERFAPLHQKHVATFSAAPDVIRPVNGRNPIVARRKDGSEFPAEASISKFELDGKKVLTVRLRDISERRRTEAILRESEQQFRIVANDTPAFLWMTSATGESSFINRPLAAFLGIPEYNTLTSGSYVVHPEDDERAHAKFLDCLARRAELSDEYRLRRFDGQYRWVLVRAIPRMSPRGEFLGYTGKIFDITDRKETEEELRSAHDQLAIELNQRNKAELEVVNLGQRLILAQEEERTRIARELHDNLGQRIGALSIGLSNLKQQISGLSGAEESAARLHASLSEVASNIRQLSHQLHPAILEPAGLAAALKSLCTEFSSLSGVIVSLQESGAFEDVPGAVALCIYRVTQEALQNVAKHAQVKDVDVTLTRFGVGVRLSVSDRGIGFDPGGARASAGLGLVSMKERVRLVSGNLAVESSLGEGTTVRLEIPTTRSATA
jgi:PAS domain S-box-containing protein